MTVPSYSWSIANLRGPDPGSPPTEAHCTNCDRCKPLDAFRGNLRLRSGLHSWCRKCLLEATQRWRAANREKINRARREAYGAAKPHKYPKSGRAAHADGGMIEDDCEPGLAAERAGSKLVC
jgi:hypothetical protein